MFSVSQKPCLGYLCTLYTCSLHKYACMFINGMLYNSHVKFPKLNDSFCKENNQF